jgi:DNA-binding NarL/FixJ family response regulator
VILREEATMNENTPERIFQPDESDVPDYEAVLACLTPREIIIVNMVADGMTSAEIAKDLQITIVSVWQAQQRIAVLGAMWENCRRLIDGPE